MEKVNRVKAFLKLINKKLKETKAEPSLYSYKKYKRVLIGFEEKEADKLEKAITQYLKEMEYRV